MTIQCETTPTAVATGLTLHIVPKGTPSSTNPSEMTGDPFCSDGTYGPNTSECEAGEWKWGSFTVALSDITKSVTPLMQMTYMQDMTPEGCAASSENDTKRLIDKRDGKYYWVAKLADGNCWMTQNLDLDLESGKSLTPEDSDVSADWDPSSTTFTSAIQGSTSYTAIQSWDPGNVVWRGNSNNTNYCSNSDNLLSCTYYWQDVSSWTPIAEYRTGGDICDFKAQTYDAHYLAGNYYSYVAATAGTGTSATTDGARATDSICPKGFELPTSGSSFNSTPGSFYNLLNTTYKIFSNATGSVKTRSAPLFFVPSGRVRPRYGYLWYAGLNGDYWSSVAYSSSYAYNFNFNMDDISPSLGSYQYEGFSVRCVAPSA